MGGLDVARDRAAPALATHPRRTVKRTNAPHVARGQASRPGILAGRVVRLTRHSPHIWAPSLIRIYSTSRSKPSFHERSDALAQEPRLRLRGLNWASAVGARSAKGLRPRARRPVTVYGARRGPTNPTRQRGRPTARDSVLSGRSSERRSDTRSARPPVRVRLVSLRSPVCSDRAKTPPFA
jgi:hypothetical protein